MTTSDGVTLRHPPIPMVDVHSRLDIDTISILSSQSGSVQHLSSYIESDDEGKGLVGGNSSRLHEAIAQTTSLNSSSQHQPSAFKKDWAMYLTKTSNGNHNKHRHNNESSSDTSESDDDESSSSIDEDDESDQDFVDDPWTINIVQREYYTKQFKDIEPDVTKVISGTIAKEFFERSRLPTSELSQIWNLSDVNHDGALSLAEFCTAMHLVVLRVNGFELPDELPPQLQPYTPLIDLSDSTTILPAINNDQPDNWANFKDSNSEIHNTNSTLNVDENPNSPKQFIYGPPFADNHRIVAPVPVRLSPPPPLPPPVIPPTANKPPPPPPRAPGRTASVDIPQQQQPILPPRTNVNETPQRIAILTTSNNMNISSANTTPFLYNRTRPSIVSTPQQSDANILLGQIRDLLQPDHLQELRSIISTPTTTTENLHTALNQTKTRNSVLKAQLKHWEDRLTDLIDKRISLELQCKLQNQQQ